MLVWVFYLCPSSVCVVATFPGTVLFPLLYSLLPFFPPNTLILFHLIFTVIFLFSEGPNLRTHPDTLNLSDNDTKGSHFGHVCVIFQHIFTHTG